LPTRRPIWLASRSPRRFRMLAEAGVAVRVCPADIDDGCLAPGRVRPEQWAMSLAYLKARCVAELLRGREEGTVLAADTICLYRGRILGQPADEHAARVMLLSMRNKSHNTITGVCVLPVVGGERWLFADGAVVRYGHVSDEEVDQYIASGKWRGKAGAYNLEERMEAGWPVECEGDPGTVMGLPMRRLAPWLAKLRSAAE